MVFMNIESFNRTLLIGIIVLWGMQVHSQSDSLPRQNMGRRHLGFYASLAPGANSTNVYVNSLDGAFTLKGLGAGWDIKLGGTLKENLILHATLIMHDINEPKYYNASLGSNGTTVEKIELFEAMFGAGITYYTELNYLLSASMGSGGFTLYDRTNNKHGTTDKGLSFQLKAGKEWWITKKWALGIAVYYHYTNVLNQQGTVEEERIRSNNFGIVCNATRHGRK